MIYLGIDNGVSGSLCFLAKDGVYLYYTPVKKHLNYTKKKAWCNRVDFSELRKLLDLYNEQDKITCLMERPMINPMRWVASQSALRCLEATLIALEYCEIPYQYIDSKEWQKALLPSGLKGPELKTAAVEVAKRLYPMIDCKKDADGLLIAHYAKLQGEKHEI